MPAHLQKCQDLCSLTLNLNYARAHDESFFIPQTVTGYTTRHEIHHSLSIDLLRYFQPHPSTEPLFGLVLVRSVSIANVSAPKGQYELEGLESGTHCSHSQYVDMQHHYSVLQWRILCWDGLSKGLTASCIRRTFCSVHSFADSLQMVNAKKYVMF